MGQSKRRACPSTNPQHNHANQISPNLALVHSHTAQHLTKDTHMDILRTAIDWTKAEMFSSAFFILFGAIFLLASLGFWQLGKTDVAKAYVIPVLVAGTLLLIIGLGLFFPSQARVTGFSVAYNSDAAQFIATEIGRADKILNDYRIVVFSIIPLIITVCALLILYFESPIWRASLITTIAMMAAILMIDTNANARLEAYKAKLKEAEKQTQMVSPTQTS
jgi:ABC-2 type transport system permease protein